MQCSGRPIISLHQFIPWKNGFGLDNLNHFNTQRQSFFPFIRFCVSVLWALDVVTLKILCFYILAYFWHAFSTAYKQLVYLEIWKPFRNRLVCMSTIFEWIQTKFAHWLDIMHAIQKEHPNVDFSSMKISHRNNIRNWNSFEKRLFH